jgi:hypothetical protein
MSKKARLDSYLLRDRYRIRGYSGFVLPTTELKMEQWRSAVRALGFTPCCTVVVLTDKQAAVLTPQSPLRDL